ncbi:MAG: DUF3604 domain-containing protein [Myxococcota bacterium]
MRGSSGQRRTIRPIRFGCRRAIGLAALLLSASACDGGGRDGEAASDGGADTTKAVAGADGARVAKTPPARDPLKQAYYGDLHVHTGWSYDAFAFGVRVAPEDAYRFARGGEIDHVSGHKVKLLGPPLDFMALTEHANYLGVATKALARDDEAMGIELLRDIVGDDDAKRTTALGFLMSHGALGQRIEEIDRKDWAQSTWQELVRLADRHDAPGTFTALIGYEYTSMPDGQNLHRNVIFRGHDVPVRPFSDLDSDDPADLWAWMDEARSKGSDVLAIPHNSNGSNGLMFERVDRGGRPIDAAQARTRVRNEPIAEVYQIKGQSEAHPALSPNDEWAGFELLENILGRPTVKSRPEGSYVRRALLDGLELEAEGLPNPFRLGMIGSSDSHNATSPSEEDNYSGKIGTLDATPEARLQLTQGDDPIQAAGDASTGSPFSSGGLAGVWAHANTREDIFDALKAREVFATSGPRIAVRLFGGFALEAGDLESGIAAAGYQRGVPMGGIVEAKADEARPFTLLVEATQDPREAPLERIQIVKGWIDAAGEARERVYDVACAGGARPDAATRRCPIERRPPDLATCRVAANQGQAQLAAAVPAPDYRAGERSFYYARVLQVPTCRWSTWDAIGLGVERLPGAVAWLQERAVTSPIWLEPPGRAVEWESNEDEPDADDAPRADR